MILSAPKKTRGTSSTSRCLAHFHETKINRSIAPPKRRKSESKEDKNDTSTNFGGDFIQNLRAAGLAANNEAKKHKDKIEDNMDVGKAFTKNFRDKDKGLEEKQLKDDIT